MTPKERAEQVVIDYNIQKWPSDGITLSSAIEQAIAAAVAEDQKRYVPLLKEIIEDIDSGYISQQSARAEKNREKLLRRLQAAVNGKG